MWMLRLPGVYRPQGDTWLLGEALALAGVASGGAVLDIGCGTGALSVLAASTAPRSITAVDVSRRAVWSARVNTVLRGVRADVRRGDGLDLVLGRRFDLVLANPPYVAGVDVLPARGPARAWDAGGDGRAVLDRLCDAAPTLLSPGGVLLIVHSALCGADTTVRRLRDGGMKAAVVARADEPFGPVMTARAAVLRARGLLEPGDVTEELVVVRGDQPT